MDCGQSWPDEPALPHDEAMTPDQIPGTAQWIIETGLEAEEALGRGETDTVNECLRALQTSAKTIYDATVHKETR